MRRLQDLARPLARAGLGTRAASTGAPLGEYAIANGMPPLHRDRKVFISARSRSAAQQNMALTAQSGAPVWRIELESEDSWINPLMGWTATGDALENVTRSNLVFQTKEAACAFAEKNGWSYEIVEPHFSNKQRPKRYQGYGDNFSTKKAGLPVGGLRSEQGEAAAAKGGKQKK